MSQKTPSQQLDNMLKIYLANINYREGELEMEVRFATKRDVSISYIERDNVVKRLLALGFTPSQPDHSLRIQTDYLDSSTGNRKQSNVRTKIAGLDNIANYCRTDKIVDLNGYNLGVFEQKYRFNNRNVVVDYANFDDYNFRVSLQVEKTLDNESGLVQSIIGNWEGSNKTFRFLNRVTFESDAYPVKVDISVVKSSMRVGANRFVDSGLLSAREHYEIEIEVNNKKVGPGTTYNTPLTLGTALKKVIKFILSGIQSTNYPVSYKEQSQVVNEYMNLLWKKNEEEKRKWNVTPRNFVGPSSFTLQMRNIMKENDDSNVPNIRSGFTVTDKADGDRKLLFIAKTGKIYLVDTNMRVQFTGAITTKKSLVSTLIDGEHIRNNKKGSQINLYAAFDIYYLNGKDVRSNPFYKTEEIEEGKSPKVYRFDLLSETIGDIQPAAFVETEAAAPMQITCKNFVVPEKGKKIFSACEKILKNVKDNMFEYNTDGLIFTPSALGVGANEPNKSADKPLKTTWKHSFKWKPAEYNTIDFLVKLEKQSDGQDFIGNIFKSGTDTTKNVQLDQYKRAILCVGYDKKKHGYMNPCQAVLDGQVPDQGDRDDVDGYNAARFYPSNPYNAEAGICNLMLSDGKTGNKVILTDNGEVVEDNMVVEFSYDESKDAGWKWTPLRVRYDKTADLKGGGRFGNAYHVANSNWHSINNPITTEIISTGKNIPKSMDNDEVYYDRVKRVTGTMALRNFHNWLKSFLISKVASPDGTLIDLAVGKGGDIPKWIAAKLGFVFGIDYSRDNIENAMDGVCARYLDARKRNRNVPKAMFVHGNTSINVRNTEGIHTDKGKQVVQAIFGEGPKDETILDKGVYDVYGIGSDGFDICSMQFAIHYMFENPTTLHNFLRNVSETTKVGGYFIGTSYDGMEIFKKLADKKDGESISIIENGEKIWQVTKKYDRNEFLPNSSCLGYAIDVYQDSINKTFREYLVNYEYLTEILENYGFAKLEDSDLKGKKLSSSSALFEDMYSLYSKKEAQKNKKSNDSRTSELSNNLKEISFLNRYFVYKKDRKVDADKVVQSFLTKSTTDEKKDNDERDAIKQVVREALNTTQKNNSTQKNRKSVANNTTRKTNDE